MSLETASVERGLYDTSVLPGWTDMLARKVYFKEKLRTLFVCSGKRAPVQC